MTYIITFIKEDGSMYTIKCKRSYRSCENLALRKYLTGNKYIAYTLNEYYT